MPLADTLFDLVTGSVGTLAGLDARSGPLAIVVARCKGKRLARSWSAGLPGWDNLRQALNTAVTRSSETPEPPDLFEFALGHSGRPVTPDRISSALAAVHSGVRGFGVSYGPQALDVVGPTDSIASNRTLRRALARLLEQRRVPETAVQEGKARVMVFDAVHGLVRLEDEPRYVPLWRGSQIVEPAAVDAARVEKFRDGMATWMRRQVDTTGRIVYKYWPSKGQESSQNNSIRQAMATLCLGRVARCTGLQSDRDIADRNLAHLLRSRYLEDGGLGLITEDSKVKLGAVSLTALALLEHPDRTRYAHPIAALCKTIDALAGADGSFRTFFRPAERNDNQNFYPGETLLFWSQLLGLPDSPVTPERYLRSFRHYRAHFRAAPNPAFVPWHTQAHCAALSRLDEPELADFVFEMNDWLLAMQQWRSAPYPDLKGRFYNPGRPEYGPPHASSTAVYLEGLIDAFALARRTGQVARGENYRRAILRGLRDLIQLQFASPEEMFYVSKPEAVFGGIRTETYDNTIRVDNVQHTLMGTLKILAIFRESDWQWPTGETIGASGP